MAHSRPASDTGPAQVEIFLEEGVAPEKIQIAHTGDTDDLGYIEGLLDKGVWIGMDRYGLDIFLPTDKRNATVTALLEKGYAERMFLSQDFDIPIRGRPRLVPARDARAARAAGQGLEHDLPVRVGDPDPEGVGMTDEQLETMLVENPKRWLAR